MTLFQRPEEQGELTEREQGEAEGEQRLSRLVAKEQHPERPAGGSADHGEAEEHPLRHPARTALGRAFVGGHHHEKHEVDAREIRKQNLHFRPPPFPFGRAFFFGFGLAQPALYAGFFGFSGGFSGAFAGAFDGAGE